jgi:hypothetical protein
MPAEARHTARGAAAEDGEAQFRHAQAAFAQRAARTAGRNWRSGGGELGLRHAEDLGADARGVHGIGRFVALAAIGRGGEIGAVGFHEDAVERRAAKMARRSWLFGKAAMPDIDR